MNYKRAVGFGVLLWILIFVVVAIIMFLPPLKEKELWQNALLWIALAPMTLFLAKWYFIKERPNILSGLLLGVVGLVAASLLDMFITVPLFIRGEGETYQQALTIFYGDWKLYVGLAEVLILCVLAGGEYDRMNWKQGGLTKK